MTESHPVRDEPPLKHPFTPARITLLGLALLAAGVLWLGVFVGLPWPDAPPEFRAEVARHERVSEALTFVGLALIALGAVLALRRGWRSRASSARGR
ncbi:MAG: hypothetical protein WCK28_07230 [Burkholderiales bacterium]